jgi:cephalosporin hydroxylase
LPYRDKPITLLEIGSAWGGALLCWDDWFTDAQIIGTELRDHTYQGKIQRQKTETNFIWYNEEFIPEVFQRENIKFYVGQNAYKSEFANSLPQVDIIVDDGWHSVDQWEELYRLYLPKIRPGGLLVIEDIQEKPIGMTPGWTIQNNLIDPIKHHKHKLFDFRNKTGKPDSVILAVWID